jgi:ABC-type enterobactin transport system permease subunit
MALLVAGLALSLFGPSGELTPARLFGAMLRPGSGDPESLIFWSLRVPRTLAVLLCGGALSAAGLLLQRTLQNDLASPGILGINAGAGILKRIDPFCINFHRTKRRIELGDSIFYGIKTKRRICIAPEKQNHSFFSP